MTQNTELTKWHPVHVFYNILDLACINAHALDKDVTNEKISRRDFIPSLAKELARPYVAICSQVPKPFPIIWRDVPQDACENQRVQCQIYMCNKNKTRDKCPQCRKPVCRVCTSRQGRMCKN
ncbi:hypothetical protein PR048_030185, partial [Dryococelus australis]